MSDDETELVLDKTHFRRIVEESQSDDTAKRLADAFSTQATQLADDISDLLNGGETSGPAVRGLLHRLRGSAEVIGACRLSAMTRRLLENDPENFCAKLRTALPLLIETIGDTLAEILTLAGQRKPQP